MCLSDRPSVISTGADLELEAGSSSDITLLEIWSARDVYPDEVVRGGQKWGSLRQRDQPISRLAIGAGADFSPVGPTVRDRHMAEQPTVISIALQNEIYMQSNKKGRENNINIAINLAKSGVL